MKLVTNIPINYSTGPGSIANGIVTGTLTTMLIMPDMSITMNYIYSSEEGDLPIMGDRLKLTAEQLQGMYDTVNADLPDPSTDFGLFLETIFYKAFVHQMVLSFTDLTLPSQIDIM